MKGTGKVIIGRLGSVGMWFKELRLEETEEMEDEFMSM